MANSYLIESEKNALERNCNKRKDILASLSPMISTFYFIQPNAIQPKKQTNKQETLPYPRCHFKELQG